MSVIPITVFFSLMLAGIFVGLFAREQRRRRFASPERESLLPLADETPRLAAAPATDAARAHAHGNGGEDHHEEHAHDHPHEHGKAGCGCRDGTRPPCAGCMRHAVAPAFPAPLR